MIIDSLKNASKYFGCHPAFEKAFKFLQNLSSENFISQRLNLDGDDLIAIFDESEGRSRAKAPLEAHKKYIDIQYVYEGQDEMGWKMLQDCHRLSQPYDLKKDIVFFEDEPSGWLKVRQGFFTVFFPEDAHAPLAGNEKVKKIIMKVAVQHALER